LKVRLQYDGNSGNVKYIISSRKRSRSPQDSGHSKGSRSVETDAPVSHHRHSQKKGRSKSPNDHHNSTRKRSRSPQDSAHSKAGRSLETEAPVSHHRHSEKNGRSRSKSPNDHHNSRKDRDRDGSRHNKRHRSISPNRDNKTHKSSRSKTLHSDESGSRLNHHNRSSSQSFDTVNRSHNNNPQSFRKEINVGASSPRNLVGTNKSQNQNETVKIVKNKHSMEMKHSSSSQSVPVSSPAFFGLTADDSIKPSNKHDHHDSSRSTKRIRPDEKASTSFPEEIETGASSKLPNNLEPLVHKSGLVDHSQGRKIDWNELGTELKRKGDKAINNTKRCTFYSAACLSYFSDISNIERRADNGYIERMIRLYESLSNLLNATYSMLYKEKHWHPLNSLI
jgi:hypothetical protein